MPTPNNAAAVSAAVNRRFFEAVDALVTMRVLPSLSGFCIDAGLSAPRYREMRLQYGLAPTPGYVSRYKNIEVEALAALVVACPSLSARWLLTGSGKMLSNEVLGKNRAARSK